LAFSSSGSTTQGGARRTAKRKVIGDASEDGAETAQGSKKSANPKAKKQKKTLLSFGDDA
jgi:hypothetical protein